MTTRFTAIVFVLLCGLGLVQTTNAQENKEEKKDRMLVYALKNIFERFHYVEKEVNDDFSEYVYTNFIDALDPNKHYFSQEDLKEFSRYKYDIDNQIKNAEITFYKVVYERFLQRLEFAKTTYKALLAKPFDYTKDESINLDYEEVPFAKNDEQLKNIWRKQLKLAVITKIEYKESEQNEVKKTKKTKKVKKKSFKQLEVTARKDVLKNMNDLYERIEELDNNDWYTTFLNSVVSGFDPHSTYMSPKIKSRFDQSMSGTFEGIGARLSKKGIYTEIFELISGGPAWKQGELEVGDIILKVAQGKGKPVEIVGMRLDNAIKYIKGKKGTEVRLTVKKKIDGSIKVIPIMRDEVEIEETFVKSSIVTKNAKKYGIINLPKFYIDFKDQNKRTASSDMEREIKRLKKEGVKGLIIDLRNNGGGSLQTVIEMVGLFIKKGPVVQVKYRGEKPNVRIDNDPKVVWDGPVVVMVNEISASASEIFAAAMQDYGRAVIIGGKQTYGKGTVQTVRGLNNFYRNYPEDLGFIKMTIQKFYRINGGSTQIEGVYSDIAMPSKFSYLDVGERDLDGALLWDKTTQASYKKINSYQNFHEVIQQSNTRVINSDRFKKINEYAKWLKTNQNDQIISLNYKKYKLEDDKKDAIIKNYKDVFKYTSTLAFKSPSYELGLLKKDTLLKDKREAWHKNLKKDIYLDEALNVLSELKLKNQFLSSNSNFKK